MPDFNSWIWSPARKTENIGTLSQHITVYLPHTGLTLILGGCDMYIKEFGNCSPLDNAFLVKINVGVDGIAIPTITKIVLSGSIPQGRALPCYALLKNDDLFLYGGAGSVDSFQDAWILNTKTFVWSSLLLKDPPTRQGRAGATCQVIENQLIVVGGFNGALKGTRTLTEPQVAIINTETWSWTSDFVASSSPKDSGNPFSLPIQVIIIIVVGICIAFMVIGFFAGRYFWKQRTTTFQEKPNTDTFSSNPLMRPSLTPDSNNSTNRLVQNRSHMMSFSDQESTPSINTAKVSGPAKYSKDRGLPLIIVPYAPSKTDSSDSHSVSVSLTDFPTKAAVKQGSYDLPDSERLPRTIADMQYGHYIRTLQHNKHYDKRRRSALRKSRPPLDRSEIISQQLDEGVDDDDDDDDDDISNDPLVNLKEVELGEECSSIPMEKLETGPMAVPNFIDVDRVPGSPHALITKSNPYQSVSSYDMSRSTGIWGQAMKSRGSSSGDSNRYEYVPGVGGTITVARKGTLANSMDGASTMMTSSSSSSSGGGKLMGRESGESMPVSQQGSMGSMGDKAGLISRGTVEIDNRTTRRKLLQQTQR
ncbi:hypothetical protein BGZ65_004667 [Modicella reniformis]|uniref:Galactose oxidase n=1 Tax=Modicella reniformis TaxID=1440133 RepID=A0A9P6LY66_9FUNG|nr:hypothetical protein BGZ65_004667 [Modicella reniformis]